MSMNTLHEPTVPQSVVDAFERSMGGFDLTRYDLDKNWGNTTRYAHEAIQSRWEGWRDSYINLFPRENLILDQQARILNELCMKSAPTVDELRDAVKAILELEPAKPVWQPMDECTPTTAVIYATHKDQHDVRPYMWDSGSNYWNVTDGSGACIRPFYKSDYVWAHISRKAN